MTPQPTRHLLTLLDEAATATSLCSLLQLAARSLPAYEADAIQHGIDAIAARLEAITAAASAIKEAQA